MRGSLSFLIPSSLPKGTQQRWINESIGNHAAGRVSGFGLPTAASQPFSSSTSSSRRPMEYSAESPCVIPEKSSQTEPPLLLEGDEFYVSHDGVARTLYQLTDQLPPIITSPGMPQAAKQFRLVAIEELYDLKTARKLFVVREEEPAKTTRHADGIDSIPLQEVLGKRAQGVAHLGTSLSNVEIQEIDQGVFGAAGTGSTTWESSIAMSLFMASHPHFLQGNVVELGSGVGLGGILCAATPSFQTNANDIDEFQSPMQSMTLTDYNPQVLEQCEQNVRHALHSGTSYPPFHVSNIDWFDFIGDGKESHHEVYDTVLVCDCAYRYPDLVALSHAMEGLLRRDDKSKIHMFAPYNRGAFHELMRQLQDDHDMELVVDWIEMKRFRLKPMEGWALSTMAAHDCPFASDSLAKFFHVTASRRKKAKVVNHRMSDLD